MYKNYRNCVHKEKFRVNNEYKKLSFSLFINYAYITYKNGALLEILSFLKMHMHMTRLIAVYMMHDVLSSVFCSYTSTL